MKISSRIFFAVGFVTIVLIPFFYFSFVYHEVYEMLKNLPLYEPNLPTRILDVNGELISELFDEHRITISVDELPSYVCEAFVVMEDRNFYRHIGFDIFSIARALIVDLFTGELRQGGSTITQQLVKRLFTGGERTFRRKIVELLLAREFERRYSKRQILEMYLNLIYFGHGAYGINSAARFYFGTDAKNLTPIQACVLASLTTAPNRLSPIRNPEATYERSKEVLARLVIAGVIENKRAAQQFVSFWSEYLDTLRERYPTITIRHAINDRAPYFTEYVRQELVKKFGAEKVYRGGLTVFTTLDLRCQKAADEVMINGILHQEKITSAYNQKVFKNFEKNYAKKYIAQNRNVRNNLHFYTSLYRLLTEEIVDELVMITDLFELNGISNSLRSYIEDYEWFRSSGRTEGALIALDQYTGAIVAMVGGKSFTQTNQFNRAVSARRQPGSAFKIFVWGAGIVNRIITAATPFFDISTEDMEPYIKWHPKNYDEKTRGMVLAREAFARSLNIVAVQIYDRIGGDKICRFASDVMNVSKKRFQIDPTLALGTSELTPLELTVGISAIANGGFGIKPFAIYKVIDKSGKIIYENTKKGSGMSRVMSAEVAFIMTELLKEVVATGTAAFAVRSLAGLRVPAAGKTGTNTSFRDAWFTGFTPYLAATVWVGCDIPRFSLGPHQTGAAVAAPLWGQFMRKVESFRKWKNFPRRTERIIVKRVCTMTGQLASPSCLSREEYFIMGTEPKEQCSSRHDTA
ncbi:MAG: PBP1A family penicillin-binding protein, partial [Spirochaetes bacterium]|nr:PBP1A family penicillin-binding protein [Spirochaetota bacterium]